MKGRIFLTLLLYYSSHSTAQTTIPTYTPDFEFLDRMQNRANAQVQSMLDAGYYYDNMGQIWISPQDYSKRVKELRESIYRLETSTHKTPADKGWYFARFYISNDPIAVIYLAKVYVKGGEVRKIKLNSKASSKLSSRSDIHNGKSWGNISNRRLGNYYGKNITIYID